jgi:hypothetical protein
MASSSHGIIKCIFELDDCFGNCFFFNSGRNYGFKDKIYVCLYHKRTKVLRECCMTGCTKSSKSIRTLYSKHFVTVDRVSSGKVRGFICHTHYKEILCPNISTTPDLNDSGIIDSVDGPELEAMDVSYPLPLPVNPLPLPLDPLLSAVLQQKEDEILAWQEKIQVLEAENQEMKLNNFKVHLEHCYNLLKHHYLNLKGPKLYKFHQLAVFLESAGNNLLNIVFDAVSLNKKDFSLAYEEKMKQRCVFLVHHLVFLKSQNVNELQVNCRMNVL